MMREILFRGKQLGNGEWVEGDLRHGGYFLNDPSVYICVPFADTIMNCPVDPNTVGQYTGMKDKNGKRIFEGDILEGRDFEEEDGYGVVEWDDGAWEVISEGNWLGTFHNNYNSFELEVIGNIHDNPELMEGGRSDG